MANSQQLILTFPAAAAGVPAAVAGIPAGVAGKRAMAAGVPAGVVGKRAVPAGVPAGAAGVPAVAAGVLAGAYGTPCDAAGSLAMTILFKKPGADALLPFPSLPLPAQYPKQARAKEPREGGNDSSEAYLVMGD